MLSSVLLQPASQSWLVPSLLREMRVNNLDATPGNADWTKRSWDLPDNFDHYRLWYGHELRDYVEHLLTLPVARAIPDNLRQAFAREFPDLFET